MAVPFFLPVKVLSRLFRRLFLDALEDAFYQGKLLFPGEIESLQDAFSFAERLMAEEAREWVVYAKPPFGGAQRALEYLGRYTDATLKLMDQRFLTPEDLLPTLRIGQQEWEQAAR